MGKNTRSKAHNEVELSAAVQLSSLLTRFRDAGVLSDFQNALQVIRESAVGLDFVDQVILEMKKTQLDSNYYPSERSSSLVREPSEQIVRIGPDDISLMAAHLGNFKSSLRDLALIKFGTLTVFAKELGISNAAVSRFLGDSESIPKAKTTKKMFNALGIEALELKVYGSVRVNW